MKRPLRPLLGALGFLAASGLASPASAADDAPTRGPEAAARDGEAKDDGRVDIVFEPTEPHVVLEQRPEVRTGVDSEGGRVVCFAGCRTRLDPLATYQIGGTWVEPASFRLPSGARGPLRITATPGSSRTAQIGTGLVLTGGALLVLGGVGTAAILGSGATNNQDAGSPAHVALTSAITLAAAGLVAILVSLPFRGETTRVDVKPIR